ncbi:MAG: phenylacetate--CoA ligase family protein [Acidobacteria bacterium]|nr:phenylacetate--CoA ligase family protein [Acidobacteriota bacterium]
MLREVLAHNPFYRQKRRGISWSKGDSSLDYLAKVPLTTKAEFVSDQSQHPPYGTNLTYRLERYRRLHQTSGTTGRPLCWLDDEASWDTWMECWQAVYRGAGVQAGDRVFVAFSFGPFIGFWTAFEAAQRMGCLAISGGGQTSQQRIANLRDHSATVLVCTPTYALRLAEEGLAMGVDPRQLGIRTGIHAGEPGASIPATRQRIQEAWGAEPFDHVGMTEVGAVGFDCEAHNGVHLNEEHFIFEILDRETGSVRSGDGRGELVVTNLGRWGMPAIRLRTGDVVDLDRSPCPCGRTFARIKGGILGRVDDMIIVRGVNVYPSAIENIVRERPEVLEFAISVESQRQMRELKLMIELSDGAPADTCESLQKALQLRLNLRTSIEVVPRGTLPRGEFKTKRIVDAGSFPTRP